MGQNHDEVSAFDRLWRRLRRAHFISTVVAGLAYAPARPAFYAFLVVLVSSLLWDAWSAFRDRQPLGEPIARVVCAIRSRLGERETIRRAVGGTLIMIVAAPFAFWLLWAAVDDAWAGPSKMGGDVNVVVATYGDVGRSDGGASPESKQLSIWLADFLRDRFAPQVGGKAVEIRRIDSVIQGTDHEAEALAIGNEVGASLVVYGDVSRSDGNIFVTPRYTFTGEASGELTTVDVAELVGESELGKRIGPIKPEDLIGGSGRMSAQCEVVVWFTTGLVAMLAGEDEAAEIFERTMELAEESGLPDNAVLHFFRGKALSADGTVEAYGNALPEFEAAIRIDPDYARPYIGLANWYYLRGADARDKGLLLKAAEVYAEAMSPFRKRPTNPLPDAKARLGAGNAYLVLAQYEGSEYAPRAREEYEAVLDLNSPCEGGLGWWDPRAWGPWDSRFHTPPDYCDEMSDMTRAAEEGIDFVEKLPPPPASPTATPYVSPVPTATAVAATASPTPTPPPPTPSETPWVPTPPLLTPTPIATPTLSPTATPWVPSPVVPPPPAPTTPYVPRPPPPTGGPPILLTSIAVDSNGDPVITYGGELAVCDRSASANGKCDQTGDWTTVTVDEAGGLYPSIAVDANGDPLISYWSGWPDEDLKFAVCDLSASANDNCDQTADWSTVTVDGEGEAGQYTSIAVDAEGDPVISYYAAWPDFNLKFAICDRSASANGNCDQTADWSTVSVDEAEGAGGFTSIAVDADGDPMLSYHSGWPNYGLNFAVCDLSASANGNCDQTADWSTVSVDEAEGAGGFMSIGWFTSIAVDAEGDPVISYAGDGLKFAVCDLSASANGNCDQTADWSTVSVDEAEGAGGFTSITVDASGDPMISYRSEGPEFNLRFAVCDVAASANANCDQTGDWSTVTVDAAGGVGSDDTSVAVGVHGDPMISYMDYADEGYDLQFAICDRSASANGNCDQRSDWNMVIIDAAGEAE